jgi:hypothetical protein
MELIGIGGGVVDSTDFNLGFKTIPVSGKSQSFFFFSLL